MLLQSSEKVQKCRRKPTLSFSPTRSRKEGWVELLLRVGFCYELGDHWMGEGGLWDPSYYHGKGGGEDEANPYPLLKLQYANEDRTPVTPIVV